MTSKISRISLETHPIPTCWIIAGPNGAGKTTFALEYLPSVVGCRHFVNADLIAAGLSPLAPEQHLAAASRLFLNEIEDCIAARLDFAFETTLSGRGYLKLIERFHSTGWRVELIYLALPSAEMSKLRVAERVAHGGHNIPDADVARRFPRSLHNLLNIFASQVDQTRCFMNSGGIPELVFQKTGTTREVSHPELFILLQQQAQP
ncbi:zeta toxin family protein [Methylomonas albis]|uniref:Zeta toxin family protein n=1 Tax=Methylomonas albis TaxID=1854563 RepID=A0ABR9D100_9GAMM|nr:zeta toxin family protein [Methylomonas albis]MBD9356773.1 zeta toxin family protein [Methylomonas albis]